MEGGNPDHPGEEGNWEVEGGGTPWDRIVTIAGEERVSRRQCVQLCHLLLGGGARRAVKNTPFLPLWAVPCGMWDLGSLTRDQTCAPCSGSAES